MIHRSRSPVRYYIYYRMYFLTKKFWSDLKNDPREAIDTLKAQGSRFRYRLVQFMIFWRIVYSEYRLNHGVTRSSALAFAMILALVPIVVTAAFMLASFIDVHPQQVEQFFARVLPFAPDTILHYLGSFFANAKNLKGWGIAGLIVVAVGLFGTVEESFNTIWKVTRPRSFFVRLRTFTMVMVYTPVLLYLSFWFRHSPFLNIIPVYLFPIEFLPFIFMALAFISLVWFVPHTRVRFGSALLGGLLAGVLFDLERRGFGGYVQLSLQTQTIYGTFAILPLFLVSLFVISLFILFGAEVAYVHQNFRPLLRAQKRWDRRVGDYKTYFIFRIFVDAVTAFARKREPPNLAWYAHKYELTEQQAAGLLNWLVRAKFLYCTHHREGYVPARDFMNTSIVEVLDEIKAQDLRVPATPADYTREFMASLLNNTQRNTRTPAEQITFGTLIKNLEDGDQHGSAAAV
jgi:membrane protein